MNDNCVILDGEKEIKIYPLMNLEEKGRNYLIYSKTNKKLDFDDIYVGEIVNDEIVPVAEDLLAGFDKIVKEVYERLKAS